MINIEDSLQKPKHLYIILIIVHIMKNLLKKLVDSCKGAISIVQTVVEVVLVVTLVPVIAVIIAGATNLSATETTILGLVTLFLVLALVFGIAKQSGLMSK